MAIWGSGDQSETFVGDVGNDTQIVGRLQKAGSDLRLINYHGRKLPKASLAGGGQSCALTKVSPAQQVGEQYLLRILVDGQLTATIRLKDVERVVCTSTRAGYARVADLTAPSASFADVRLSALTGVVGAIVADG